MIYFNSDSTSNGVSTIVATFDVGYSQDIGAVDIQNRVETAQAVLPPEVKQFGVTIKKTSTDMVCVVNLVSPDGRYDSNFLDNYAQIYVLDELKRVTGVSDVVAFGRKYAMRVWLDPDKMAAEKISPAEVIQAIQSENRQAAAGRIGGSPMPAELAHKEFPILTKGRLTSAKEFEQIVVRRRDDGSILRLDDVADVKLESENYDTAGWLSGKPAGTLPVYQYSDANALEIVRQVREKMDRLARSFPPGLEYKIAYDTTKYVRENIEEVEHTLLEAFMLVLVVIFVFLQGVRATIIPMLAIPVALVATFSMMAAFGFSINTLTLCGLILAIGLVVDDAIIVVENVEKYLERGDGPARGGAFRHGRDHRADRHDHARPGGGLRAGGVHPGSDRPAVQPVCHDDRLFVRVLGGQLADLQPGDGAAVPAAQARRNQVLLLPLVQRTACAGSRTLMTASSSSPPGTGGRSCCRRSRCSRSHTGCSSSGPRAFIPTEDQGYLIVAMQTPDGTGREATAHGRAERQRYRA